MRLDMTKFVQEFNSKYTETTDLNSLSAFAGKRSQLMDAHIPSKMTSQRFSEAWIDKKVKQISQKNTNQSINHKRKNDIMREQKTAEK